MTTQTTTPAKNIFPSLFAAFQQEISKEFNQFAEEPNKETSVSEILSKWYYKSLLTKTKQRQTWELQPLKNHLTARRQKQDEKRISEKLTHLERVSEAGRLQNLDISIEWKTNRTWGANPTGTADVKSSKDWNRFLSGSISGCGYDKESTAFAHAVNQSDAFLHELYLVKECRPTDKNADVFGYGSGYGIFPKLEGGVGTSCFYAIFEKIGFKMRKTGSGKMFDVYTVTKI